MSATDLQKIIDGDLDTAESVEYLGYHIMSQGDGTYNVQLDGYAGSVGVIDVEEHDSALEIVDEINRIDTLREEHMYHGDEEDMVEWAGKIMTNDEERVEEEPEMYVYVPPPGETPEIEYDLDE